MTPAPRTPIPSAARLGLFDSAASANLADVGWAGTDDLAVLWSLSRAPDPDMALRTLVRLRDAIEAPAWERINHLLHDDTRFRGRLFAVMGASEALGDLLVAEHDSWQLLLNDELPDIEAMRAQLLAAVQATPDAHDTFRAHVTGPAAIIALRSVYRNFVLQVAARDLAPAVEDERVLRFTTVGGYLADLADAALTSALAVAVGEVCGDDPLTHRIAVIAMGKCGARELNYVSDVDVIFVAEPADSCSARIAGEMMRVGGLAFFEVDAALRPEGKAGALTRSLTAHTAYYQRWAKTWEFQALVKARPMTGDMELGRNYIAAVSPLVWEASTRDDFVLDVQAMRRRVEDSVPSDLRARELKLGSGSIRDVEFAVQLLQMVHGRVDPELRVPATVAALSALTAGGYVGRDDGANLTASYEFLRLLEHRLQLHRLKRTHLLPELDDDEAMRFLARCAHIRPEGDLDTASSLRAEIRRQSQRVRRLHEKLFYRPLLEAVSHIGFNEVRLSDDAAASRMGALGYAKPTHALNHLRALLASPGRRGQIQQLLLPTLLEWLSRTPDPDAGLLNYRRLCEALEHEEWFLRLLRDDGLVAERLMYVLGASSYIADLLVRSPEVVRLYADSASGPKLHSVELRDVAGALMSASRRQKDPKRAIAVARSLRRAELVRVASADILGIIDVPQVCEALSNVWAAVLNAALAVVIDDATVNGEDSPARIAVIGMGRLGGAELGYGSDADVLFVCEPTSGADETVAVRWANTIAERVRTLLSTPSIDPPLEIDTGLRPEGRNGAVVRTLAAYAAYYREWSQPWEMQALLRAHPVAGDAELGMAFLHMADKTRYPAGGVSSEAVREIRRIKARVDAERLPRGADPFLHTKLGRGGLADIEWTVQLLQLQHAHDVPTLHNTSTLQTLDAIGAAELLSETDVALLKEAWLTATAARNALVLVRGKAVDQIPGPGQQLRAVAFAAGWGDHHAAEFQDNYLRVTRRAKAVVRKVFGV